MLTDQGLQRIEQTAHRLAKDPLAFSRDSRARAVALLRDGEEITAAGYARQAVDGWPSLRDVAFGEAPVDWGRIDAIGLVDAEGVIYRKLRLPFYREVKATDSTTVRPDWESSR
jgi:hypothetical protein